MMRTLLLATMAATAAAVPKARNATTVNSTAHRNPKMTRRFIVDECKPRACPVFSTPPGLDLMRPPLSSSHAAAAVLADAEAVAEIIRYTIEDNAGLAYDKLSLFCDRWGHRLQGSEVMEAAIDDRASACRCSPNRAAADCRCSHLLPAQRPLCFFPRSRRCLRAGERGLRCLQGALHDVPALGARRGVR